ncbi:MAG TPA: hypothetical protein VMI31_00080 [Fimbriimonadaceae bacterium]|nr:hypothetical protein [Fimbriimonadaceae bacterium]
MFDLWKDPLTEEKRDELLDRAALEIRKRKMEVPAILFLEMHKPLAYVGSQALVVFAPFLIPFVGFDNLNNYSLLLSERGNVELLIQRLEKRGDDAAKTEEVRCIS